MYVEIVYFTQGWDRLRRMQERHRLEYGTIGIGLCAIGSGGMIAFLLAAQTSDDFELWSPLYGTLFVLACLAAAGGLYLIAAVFLPLWVPPLRNEKATWHLPHLRFKNAKPQPLPGLDRAGRRRISRRREVVLAIAALATGLLTAVAIETLIVRPIVEATDQRIFVPSSGGRELGSVSPQDIYAEGTCSPSYADPDREGAYRCIATDGTYRDPCFLIATAHEAACFPDPWSTFELSGVPVTPAYLFSSVSVKTENPRPRNGWARPWALELDGGHRCLLLLRRQGLDPEGTYYPCFKGPPYAGNAQASGWVFDYPNKTSVRWTVPFVPSGRVGAGSRTVRVTRAWR